MHNDIAFSLNEKLDPTRLRDEFRRRRRIEIRAFLADGQAEALRSHLLARGDWTLVLNAGEKVFEIPRAGFAEMTEEQKARLDASVAGAARSGFQYRYETIRVPDDPDQRDGSGAALDRFVDFMSSGPVVGLMRRITGHSDIEFADGQATSYSPGHFLTAHDDDVEGKNRRAAYVLGLAPVWRADWGGLLMFHGPDGNIAEAFTPAMGALRLFAVPAAHSVSFVTPFAPGPRLSVTGWLRAR
ncbi:2OG-Fe(II) oxygenase [Allosphingosinicella sp.]|jgi:Rps23 Pro-64 3,4-dihydroxylase Tpa1-like proline 4-hydroxylase|uniref:2OG-Fe(II) oxygenase n=1 Tax=Allosphingosinicella sp. TaxID=2823234 RepID=UPI002EDFB22C